MRIKTVIPIEPVPKGRPRTIIKGGRAIIFTPTKTERAENQIRLHMASLNNKEIFDKDVPLRIGAIFYRLKPKSSPKRVKLPVAKPDVDNYYKLLTDALEKLVYYSDAQLTTVVIKKRFGTPPRIELLIEEDTGG